MKEPSEEARLRAQGSIPAVSGAAFGIAGVSTTGANLGAMKLTSATTEKETGTGAQIPMREPKKKRIVVIEKLVQEVPADDLHVMGKDVPSSGGFFNNKGREIIQYLVRDEAASKKADIIFLHYTGDKSLNWGSSAITVLSSPQYVESSHFVLTRNGRIVQLFDFDKKVHTQGGNSQKRSVYLNSLKDNMEPNLFGYSIECAAECRKGHTGMLAEAQIEMISYNLRYIRDEANRRYGVPIKFNRIWKGLPDLPPIGETETGYKEKDGITEMKCDYREFQDVYGALLGHNEASGTPCPGAMFPWIAILEQLGVWPKNYHVSGAGRDVYQTQLEKFKQDVATFYEKVDAGENPSPPFYNEPGFVEDEVEYVVWQRTLTEILGSPQVLNERNAFLTRFLADRGEKLKDYEVMGDQYDALYTL